MSIINGTGYRGTKPIRINMQPNPTFEYFIEPSIDSTIGDNHNFLFPHGFPIASLELSDFNSRGAYANAVLSDGSSMSKRDLQRMNFKAFMARRFGIETTLMLAEDLTREDIEKRLGKKTFATHVAHSYKGPLDFDATIEDGWALVAHQNDRSKTGPFLDQLVKYACMTTNPGKGRVNIRELYARIRDISGVNYARGATVPDVISYRG